MIGFFPLGPGRTAVAGDDGRFITDPADPDMTESLNMLYARDEVGDHHRPFGVARLCRAAAAFGAEPTIAVEPYPPLPEGAVS